MRDLTICLIEIVFRGGVFRFFVDSDRFLLAEGNPILLIGPGPEIEDLTALTAEGPRRIGFEVFYFFSASGTFDLHDSTKYQMPAKKTITTVAVAVAVVRDTGRLREPRQFDGD